MDWPRILAYITGTVDQELLLRNEYLVAENRILRQQVNGRLLLSDAEKKTLAEIGYRLGRKTLATPPLYRQERVSLIRPHRALNDLTPRQYAETWQTNSGTSP